MKKVLFNLTDFKYYKVAAAGWLNRFIGAICQIVSISIALNYLGISNYAIFAIILGLQNWFTLTDLGFGFSLQNYVSEAKAKQEDMTALFNNSALAICIIFAIVATIFCVISPWLQYFLLRNIAPNLATSKYYFLIFIGLILIGINVFGIGYKIFIGKQKGYLMYNYQTFAYLIGLLDIILVSKFNVGAESSKTFSMLVGWLSPSLIFSLACFFKCFKFNKIFAMIDFKIIKKILQRGIKFWIFNIIVAFALMSDYLIISQTLNNEHIAIYNILAKSFALIFFIYSAVLTGLWPVLAELFVQKNKQKANNLIKKNLYLGFFVIIICTLIFLLFKNMLITILAPKSNLLLPASGILLFGIYYLLRTWVDTYATALLSQNSFKVFWISSSLQAIISVSGMYFFSLFYGLNGIIYGLILSLIVTAIWMLPRAYYKNDNNVNLPETK
jgi:O-antigen/teichoic acid export membrane protein